MKHLHAELNTQNDSFSYTVIGEQFPVYIVDSSGYLTHDGKQIGEFKLTNKQWHLLIGETLFMSGPENDLFGLPEFELKALTKLINQQE